MAFLKVMKEALLKLLQAGFNPYEDNSQLEAELFNENTTSEIVVEEKVVEDKTQPIPEKVVELEEISIIKALNLV